ncbi:histidine kinase [Pseudoflavonifractor phocaeensis]|nr:histidine kinase [Pseudoflavonifractor phocaeensis]
MFNSLPQKAKEMILVLANYFRQALSINEPFVTLEQELSNVDNFLTLVEARFEDAICVEWDRPEPLPVAYLPPLILQPIVENAVRHGGTSVDDQYVHIKIQQRGECVCIKVADHGHGFPPEILERLQDPGTPAIPGCSTSRSVCAPSMEANAALRWTAQRRGQL